LGEQESLQQKLVPAVERASVILDIVAAAKRYPTVSELARETALPKSTVHALCMTLVKLGLLIRRPDQTYLLGPHLLRWSNAFERQTDVAAEFAALWDQTEVAVDTIVSLCIPDEADVVFIAARQTHALGRFPLRPGMRLPAPFCAAGKAIIASWPDYEILRTFGDRFPEKLTSRSVGNVGDLMAEIREIRALGVAIEVGQCEPGVTNLAKAVLNSLNRPVAAVMMSIEGEGIPDATRRQLTGSVANLAARLSHRLGADVAA
jgi:DNA-binding IclR family transcriptional regulator